MFLLSEKEMKSMSGSVVSTAAILGYVAVAAGIAAIVKIITSSKGKVSVPGVNITWGS